MFLRVVNCLWPHEGKQRNMRHRLVIQTVGHNRALPRSGEDPFPVRGRALRLQRVEPTHQTSWELSANSVIPSEACELCMHSACTLLLVQLGREKYLHIHICLLRHEETEFE